MRKIQTHHQANTTVLNCCRQDPPTDAKISGQKFEEQEDIYQYKGGNSSFTVQKLGDTLSK